MGAPGIEPENPVTTMIYYALLRATVTALVQGITVYKVHYAQLQPPTYEPPTGHPYKCPGGQP
jgi:hypothetical protein